jgi:UDP-N-acetylglucosamine 2-epimerase (non-hydrolysing)
LSYGQNSQGDHGFFEKVCIAEQLDIVVGDVNSTMACTITAKKLGIKVAHVEAGLRSRDMGMPEEINRLCIDVLCDLEYRAADYLRGRHECHCRQ